MIPLVSTRGRGIEALKMAIDRHQQNQAIELVHYPQPLLREADKLAQAMVRGYSAAPASLAGFTDA